jgi:hypothetical protein
VTGVPTGYGSRDSQDIDALAADRYLESILAAHGRGADWAPMPAAARLDPGVRFAIERLTRDLPRLHPSFRFEEALASRLSEAAARMRRPVDPVIGAPVVALADRRRTAPARLAATDDRDGPFVDPRVSLGRPLLIGGALTSAALSIAGAAYVAWRIRHPQKSTMARAVRAVARTRPT